VLEFLCMPLGKKVITISRVQGSFILQASNQMVAALNP